MKWLILYIDYDRGRKFIKRIEIKLYDESYTKDIIIKECLSEGRFFLGWVEAYSFDSLNDNWCYL